MAKSDFKVIICDMPHREELIAELYYKNEQWVEISAETPHIFEIRFYNHETEQHWEFPFDKAMSALQQAKDMLAEKQRTPEQQKEYDEMMERHRIELESKNNLRE